MTGSGLVVGLTGPTGHLGGLLLRRLLDDQGISEVRSVARRGLPPPLAPSGRDQVAKLVHTRADLRQPEARKALQGVDLLYHLAAQVWQKRGPGRPDDMYGANVEGTRNVLLARPGAVVLASSAAVYGAWPDNPRPLDELHVPRPNVQCPYALHKLLAEQACAVQSGRWVALRIAAVLGPHADARVARAVRGYRLAVPSVRHHAQAVQWLDESDAVNGLLAAGQGLLAGTRANGHVVNLATEDWLEAHDVARLARSRVIELPLSALVGVSELGNRLGLTPFGADRAVLIAGPLALSVTKAEQVLGWRPSKSSAQVLAGAIERNWRDLPRNRQL
jgi:UDP-glucose 4-epimerase